MSTETNTAPEVKPAEHSPGPFTVERIGLGFGIHRPLSAEEKRKWGIDQEEERPMSLIMVDRDGYALVTEEADAHLFAAAPEMLEALKQAKAEICEWRKEHADEASRHGSESPYADGKHTSVDYIDAAIAKATQAGEETAAHV